MGARLTPRITVVIPTLGRFAFLLDAIRSVVAQTNPVSQIVLVDDSADEEVHRQMMEVAASFPIVELHTLDNSQGVSAARNFGLRKATGDYVIFLDDDDLLHPRMVESAMGIFSTDQKVDAVVCLYGVLFSPVGLGDYPGVFPFDPRTLEHHPLSKVDNSNFAQKRELECLPVSAFLRYFIPVNSCIVKRSVIGDTQFPEDLQQGEDTFFWLNLGFKGCQFHLSEEFHVFVRRHGQNATRSKLTYIQEIPMCYRKLLSSGLVTRRQDIFLVKLKLFYFAWKQDSTASLRLIFGLLHYPELMVQEIIKYFRVTVRDRKRLMKYYFQD